MKMILIMWILLVTTMVGLSDIPKEAYPKWWDSRGVVTSDISNDFTPVNHGQVKHMAISAYAEIKDLWPENTPVLDALIAGLYASDTDYCPLNIGQLKNIAQPFFDFRATFGISQPYPWDELPGYDGNDFRLATGMDLKEFFFWELPATTNFIYVATNGVEGATGTIDDPYGDLRHVMTNDLTLGVSVIIRGGDYPLHFTYDGRT